MNSYIDIIDDYISDLKTVLDKFSRQDINAIINSPEMILINL